MILGLAAALAAAVSYGFGSILQSVAASESTERSSRRSVASYTRDMPPSPSSRSMR